MLSVSSWWYERAVIDRATPERELMFITDQGSAYDLGPHVKKWPTIKHKANEFKVSGFTFEFPLTDLASYHSALSARDPQAVMRATWKVNVGYIHPASGPEMVTLFTGRARERTVGNGIGAFEIEAADTRLTERKLGADGTSAAVVYNRAVLTATALDYATPADLAWVLCTSAGGMDPTETAANSDLNYSQILSWHATFSESYPGWGTVMNVKGSGHKIAGVLTELLKQSHSLGWVGLDGRISFDRRNGIGGRFAPVGTIADDLLVDATFSEPRDYRPNQIEGYIYNVGGDLVSARTLTNTPNLLAYGLNEDEWQSENCWHEATDFVEMLGTQLVGTGLHLQQIGEILLPFAAVFYGIGDIVQITNTPHMVSSTHWTAIARQINLEDLTIKLSIEERLPKVDYDPSKAAAGERTLARPLSSLLDVGTAAPSSGQVLAWDGGSMWLPATPVAGTGVGSLGAVPGVSTSAPTSGQMLGHDGSSYWVPVTPAAGSAFAGAVPVYFNASPTAVADSNALGAPHFGFGTYRHVQIADLTAYTQVKFIAQRATAALTGATAYEIELMFCDTFVTDIGSYQTITVTSRCAMLPTDTYTMYETGWLTLVASARTQVHLAIMAQSGNGTADPNFGMTLALFKP